MIITRTPLRISIGGGGTDLPSYYSRFGGTLITAAIDRHLYITLHRTFVDNYIIKYSQMETVESVSEIRHPIVREIFRIHDVKPRLEMVSMADIPAGTGLGSSGAFNVGLHRAIYHLKHCPITTHELAEEACRLEIDVLKEPVGKQDQYVAAYGGLICMEINKDGEVKVSPLSMSDESLFELQDNLLMFFTGYSRSASDVLRDQKAKTEKDDSEMIDNLHAIKELGHSIKTTLERGELYHFGELMHKHWLMKQKRTEGISNDKINEWYEIGRRNGAVGGKLIGAGGGGFILFYCEDRSRLKKAMKEEGLTEVRFTFDHEGSKVLVDD